MLVFPDMVTASSLPQGSGNDRFSAEAAAWDSNPFVHQASKAAFEAIRARFPQLQLMSERASKDGFDVLEIGCGTGLLTMRVAPNVRTIVAVDAAQGMIDVLKAKLDTPEAPHNIQPVCVLLGDPDDNALPPVSQHDLDGPRLRYDLILSHLVLHHVGDLEGLLRTMLGCLKKGGSVALTDFEDFGPEATRFHPKAKMDGVERHGIKKDWMAGLMEKVG
jgi:2-polyprenyl-3-methyl-5-hydroxy-6-metoxy-1,4-benzoquinol methylase